jgi:hypothetical protein
MKPTLIIFAIHLVAISTLVGQTTTIVATAPPGSIGTSPTLTVPSNQVATVLRVFIPPDSDPLSGERYPFVNVRIGTNEFASPGNAPVTVAGPASIKITIDNTNPFFTTPASAYGTIRISDEQTQLPPAQPWSFPATPPARCVLFWNPPRTC